MVIQIAQQIGPAPFATVVGSDTHCSNDKHDRAHSHAQPGLVHATLLGQRPERRLPQMTASTLIMACRDDGPCIVYR
ncbi:hypothetical protein PWR63_30305 [Paraburkholderia sp. A2WS-5]|uniref:hypothetical protein n=1 Tax=unclassified Paraburkholderia TaxID=2615204 RepID=UPI003B7E49F0